MPTTVCWFVQSHRDPEQILRLLHTLRRGSCGPIVLRHDHDVTPLDPSLFTAIADLHLLPASGPQIRADFSCQMQPYLDCLEWLEREGVAYDWVVNMTAQDYPVTPVPRIESFLAEAACDGFVRHWDVLSPSSPWSRRKARARYWHRYWRLRPAAEPALRALRRFTRFAPLHFYLDYGPYVGVRCLRTPFGDDLRCRGGRAWWTLRREVARYVLEVLERRPDVVAHYRRTVAPEESFVQTVLVASGRFDLVNDDLRLVDYSRAVRGSPRTLTGADWELLASGRYHLARKFDLGVDRGIVDRIDREIHGGW